MYSDENPRTNIMKRTLLFITSLVLIVGCSKEPINYETLIDKDGLKYHPDTKELYSGKVFSLNGNGQKEFEGSYKDGKRDGLRTGWYENGQKWYEITYKDGELDGLHTEWYDNGQKWKEGTYKDDELISSKCWSDDGEETHCDDEENW